MDAASVEYWDRMEAVKAEVGDATQRLERLYDAPETGRMTMDDLAPRIQQLRDRQKQLLATRWELEALLADRHLELADAETVGRYVQDLRTLLTESALAERRSFIRSFVTEVKATGDKVVVSYTIPMPSVELTYSAVTVPPIVQYGGRYRT